VLINAAALKAELLRVEDQRRRQARLVHLLFSRDIRKLAGSYGNVVIYGPQDGWRAFISRPGGRQISIQMPYTCPFCSTIRVSGGPDFLNVRFNFDAEQRLSEVRRRLHVQLKAAMDVIVRCSQELAGEPLGA